MIKSLGESLRSTREERGISIEQAVHETNITQKYIVALEDENFDVFPAEAYVLGYLRSYSEFLGLDPDKSITKFRNLKLVEKPTPMDELVGPPRGRSKKIVLYTLLVLAGLAALVYAIPQIVSRISDIIQTRAENLQNRDSQAEPRIVTPTQPLWQGLLGDGDTVILQDRSGNAVLRLGVESGESRLVFSGAPTGDFVLLLGDEIYVPDSTGTPTWRIYLKDFGLPLPEATADPAGNTENAGTTGTAGIVEIQWLDTAAAAGSSDIGQGGTSPGPSTALPDSEFLPQGTGSQLEERQRPLRILESSPSIEQFVVEVDVQDFTLLRYRVGSQPAVEDYYSSGRNFRLNAGRSATLWVSDAGAVIVTVNGQEVSLGGRGEVVVYQIRWVLNDQSRLYELSLLPLY